jgi:hypothetical protein
VIISIFKAPQPKREFYFISSLITLFYLKGERLVKAIEEAIELRAEPGQQVPLAQARAQAMVIDPTSSANAFGPFFPPQLLAMSSAESSLARSFASKVVYINHQRN